MKKPSNVKRKLELSRETVRAISEQQLQQAAGGAPSVGCSNNSCDRLHGTCKLN